MKTVLLPLFLLLTSGLLAQTASFSSTIPGIARTCTWTNTPVRSVASGDSLVIEAGGKTDMFRDPNVTYNTDNAPRLSFIADPNFVFTVAIHHPFTSKWDGGAIVLEADKMNWIKFCFEKDYTGVHRVVSVVTKDISDDCNSVAVRGDIVFYKMAKADNVITLYYSLDGKSWYLIRHLQFNSRGPLKLGLLAQSPTGKRCRV